MATTQAEIREWINQAVSENATHMLVVCDTFDWEDYPVIVGAKQNVRDVYAAHNGPNMQRVMEVYNLKMDLDAQLREVRAFNF